MFPVCGTVGIARDNFAHIVHQGPLLRLSGRKFEFVDSESKGKREQTNKLLSKGVWKYPVRLVLHDTAPLDSEIENHIIESESCQSVLAARKLICFGCGSAVKDRLTFSVNIG